MTNGRQVSLAKRADIDTARGPSMIRNENGLLTGYVFVEVESHDPVNYIAEADTQLRQNIDLLPGHDIFRSGQYEAMARGRKRQKLVIPITLFLFILLLYLNTRSTVRTFIVLLAAPFSVTGAIWLLYPDLAYKKANNNGKLSVRRILQDAIRNGDVRCIRPKFMTVSTISPGLIPIMWAMGAGSDVMKRIASHLIGIFLTSFLFELLIYPVVYEIWKWHSEVKKPALPA